MSYKSIHTGQQIDTGVSAALNPDTIPTAGSDALMTSGGTKSAISDVTPISEALGSGHTLIRCGKLRILNIAGFYIGYATITVPQSDRPSSAASGLAIYNDSNGARTTFGYIQVNADGSIQYYSAGAYNDSGTAYSEIGDKWVSACNIIWMVA